jgi:hypothetical protein
MPPRIIYANPSTTAICAFSKFGRRQLLRFALIRMQTTRYTRHVYFLPDLRADFLLPLVYFRVIPPTRLQIYSQSMNQLE